MFFRGLWDVSLNGDLIEISQRHLLLAGLHVLFFLRANTLFEYMLVKLTQINKIFPLLSSFFPSKLLSYFAWDFFCFLKQKILNAEENTWAFERLGKTRNVKIFYNKAKQKNYSHEYLVENNTPILPGVVMGCLGFFLLIQACCSWLWILPHFFKKWRHIKHIKNWKQRHVKHVKKDGM